MNQARPSTSSAASRTSFVVVALILLAAAIVLNAAVQNFKLHFKKEAVAQPRDFHTLPPAMGKWLQISEDDKLDKEMEDVLGTDQYCYRDYLQVDQAGSDLLSFLAKGLDKPGASTRASVADDTSMVDQDVSAKFSAASFESRCKMITDALAGRTPGQRKEIAYAIELKDPGSVLHLGLTYYTGLVDTVAHIPERCYIADGFDVKDTPLSPTWALGKDSTGKDQAPLEVRFISFQDQTGQNRVPKCVSYVFNVNGQYESNPLAVRQSLEDLTQRYGYYAKIEMMTIGDDTDLAQHAMTDFIGAARGQVDTCFPNWKRVVESHR